MATSNEVAKTTEGQAIDLTKKYVKFLISDVLKLPVVYNNADVHSAYAFHNYHVRQVEIVGYVVSVDVRERRAVYIIDDSTGVISCVKWINNEADKQRFSHFKHGDLLIVRGKIGSFREERQIKIDNMAKQSDLHVEILHWLEAIKFAVNSQKEKDTTKQKTSAHEK